MKIVKIDWFKICHLNINVNNETVKIDIFMI